MSAGSRAKDEPEPVVKARREGGGRSLDAPPQEPAPTDANPLSDPERRPLDRRRSALED